MNKKEIVDAYLEKYYNEIIALQETGVIRWDEIVPKILIQDYLKNQEIDFSLSGEYVRTRMKYLKHRFDKVLDKGHGKIISEGLMKKIESGDFNNEKPFKVSATIEKPFCYQYKENSEKKTAQVITETEVEIKTAEELFEHLKLDKNKWKITNWWCKRSSTGRYAVSANLKNIEEESQELRKYEEEFQKFIEEKNKPKKVLFFDIEVSPNIVVAWRAGYKLNISPDDIIQERAIICIGYKWEGDDNVYSLQWNNGDDKDMLIEFSEIINSADVIVGQNSDRFDIKWLRTRCLYHNVPFSPKFNSLDTLKFAKNCFYFNSNKLDYMGKFLGLGEKIHTDFDLWKRITLDNDEDALYEMVEYCKNDVILLEDVYQKLKDYVPEKKFKKK